MAIKSYPYSSVDGDRKITASDEAKRLDLIAGSGIIFDVPTSFECSKLAGTMNINVAAGSALVAGHGIISDATETVEISASDSAYSRIDVIALESNTNTDIRAGRVVVIKGTAAATPIEPTLSTEAGVTQIKLAKILIPASISSLSTATLTDLRAASVGKHTHTQEQMHFTDIMSAVYPVGSIYMSTSSANPNTLFGVGTWVAWGTGRVPVGIDTSQSEFNTVGKTGGAKTHTLVTGEMPNHGHTGVGIFGTSAGSTMRNQVIQGSANWDGYTGVYNTGGDLPHNNLQPYVTCYMWKRTI